MVINRILDFIDAVLTVGIVIVLVGGVVWGLGAWMQNNPVLAARREKQNHEAMRLRIAQEIAANKKK